MRAVLKIGGGILRNREDLEILVEIVKMNFGRENILVVSALNGVTDMLLNAYAKGEDISGQLRKMHQAYFDSEDEMFGRKFSELSELLSEKTNGMERKERIASFGERLSAILVSEYLNSHGISAETMDAERCGIVADGKFERANCVMEKTKTNFAKNVIPKIKERTLVISGFYGVDSEGNVNTFGRGGSDYSAAVVAVASRADVLEIWKDVEGFMTADPRVVKDAKKLDEITFEEAKELGYMGAKILHPRTMDPLEGSGISAQIKSVFDPSANGTRIVEKRKENSDRIITSIAAKKKIAIVNVKGSAMVNMPGVAAKIFNVVADNGVSIDTIATSQVNISFTVDEGDAEKVRKTLDDMPSKIVSEFWIKTGFAAIGVVGEGIRGSVGTSARIFDSVAKNKVNIEMISQAATDSNITIIIRQESVDECIRAIHEEFKLGE